MALVGSQLQIFSNDNEAITNAAGNPDSHGAQFNTSLTMTDGNTAGNSGSNTAHKVGDLLLGTTTNNANVDFTAFAGGINSVDINFTCLRKLAIQNLDPANSVTMTGTNSGGATNVLTGTRVIGPMGTCLIVEPINGVTIGSTSKILGFAASAGTPNIRITAVGQGS
jgi:hypothetical protein